MANWGRHHESSRAKFGRGLIIKERNGALGDSELGSHHDDESSRAKFGRGFIIKRETVQLEMANWGRHHESSRAKFGRGLIIKERVRKESNGTRYNWPWRSA